VTEAHEPAEAAWRAWYKPGHDIARAMATSPYDQMHGAFLTGAAAERERSEALIVQAQDYARAESERAAKLAALALRALNQCHALERDDSAPYLDEWSMALEQLESAAGEMSPPDGDPLEDAYQTGIKAERERIARLALAEADRGAKSGLDRIALRAFAQRLTAEAP
jgi:hypothetical protein